MSPLVKYTGFSVYLNCSNVEKSAAFYEGLGLKRVQHFPEMGVSVYDVGGLNLVLGPADMPTDEATAKWLAMKPWGVGMLLMPTVKSVDDVHARAKAMGAEIEQPPTDQPWGSRTVGVVDPDGYSIIFEQPAAPPKKRAKPKAAKAKTSGARKTTKKNAPARRRR